MSEIWTPNAKEFPDVHNIFDMMLVLQENLDSLETVELKHKAALFAVKALGTALHESHDEQPQVTVVTDLLVMDDEEPGVHNLVKARIGLNGVVDDVHCLHLAKAVPLSVMLGVDVVSIFPVSDPDDITFTMNNVRTPINKIQSIKTLAS